MSNCHINPAVTLGVLIREQAEERANGKREHNCGFALMIMLSQITGASIAAVLIYLMHETKDDGSHVGVARLCGTIGGKDCDGHDGNGVKMLFAEVIGTFLFVSTVVSIIYHNGSQEIILNAILIGFTLVLALMVAAPISGASINPAVGLVLPIFQHLLHDIRLD